jgi:sugar phosphate isomerase/epimerase
MRVGVDSYSYHRLYGEIRPGERPRQDAPWPLEPGPVLAHARAVGADVVMLETCYLPGPDELPTDSLGADAGLSVRFSWGHPWPAGAFHGLDGGRTPAAETDLARWIDLCARLGHEVMRITLGSPATRTPEPSSDRVGRLVDPVRRAADRAANVDLALAIENHGDLTAAELKEIIDRADRANVGVTLDNVNLIRLGDDMIEGTRLLAPHTLVVQLKDHVATEDPSILGGPVCTTLGEGDSPLLAVLAELDAVGFDGPICVELASLGPEPEDELSMIDRSVQWLRRHVAPRTADRDPAV